MLQKDQAVSANTHTLPASRPRIVADFITSEPDIREIQRLRYEVFCEEYNVTLPVNMTWNGQPIDADELDDHCLHLVVRDTNTNEPVGYTRVLTSEQAEKLGHYYSSHEFHIDRIVNRPGRFLEIGRTCIHPDYRNGATIAVLWSFLAKYMMEFDYQYLFGCASISLNDGGTAYANIMQVVRDQFMAEEEFRVEPLLPLQLKEVSVEGKASFPPLLKAYTRMGARICGEACWDPDFNVADVFVLLDINNVAARYAKHFLKTQEAA